MSAAPPEHASEDNLTGNSGPSAAKDDESGGAQRSAGTASPRVEEALKSAAASPETPRAERKRKKGAQPHQVGRGDVKAIAADQDRLFKDSVTFNNCWISAGSFIARDSIGTAARKIAVSQVRPEQLRKLADVFVAQEGAASASDELRSTRLICLRGAEGCGRTSLATWLLHKQLGDDVWEISPRTPVAEIFEAGLASSLGYFLTVDAKDRCREFDLDQLRSVCEQAKCYIILIAPLGRPEFPSWLPVFTVRPPSVPRIEILRKHVLTSLTTDERPIGERLLARSEVTLWCEAPRSMAELELVAKIIADVAGGRIDEADLPKHLDLATGDQMRLWFDNPDSKSLRSLKITLSFFGGLPVQTVLDLETCLSDLLSEAAKDTAVRELFEPSLACRLHDASATVRTCLYQYEHGDVHTEVAEFTDQTLERRLASLLRTGYPRARPVLVHWLCEAATHADHQVQFRAAMAIGGFITDGQPMLLKQVIEPWATQPDVQFALRVACALVGPLRSPETGPSVSRVLERWTDSIDRDVVFAAAMVYGLAVPQEDASGAIAGLERIAQIEKPDVADWRLDAAATGVIGMFLRGLVTEVLGALSSWNDSDEPVAPDLARSAFLWIADHVVEELERPPPTAADADSEATGDTKVASQTWPSLLVAAAAKDTRPTVVALWQSVLDDMEWSALALDTLKDWFERADDRAYLVTPLTDLISALSATEREAKRLAYYLGAWANKNPKGAAASCRSRLLARGS